VLDQLNGAIANGTIDEVLPGLVGKVEQAYTIEIFWKSFRDEYCKPHLTSWKRYQLSFDSINAQLGSPPLREFRRHHLHEFIEKRCKRVSPSTVNKDIAAIKKMFSYALEVGAVESHPLVKFPTIKTQQKVLRLPADGIHSTGGGDA
jgi:site-specific recombinase XerD